MNLLTVRLEPSRRANNIPKKKKKIKLQQEISTTCYIEEFPYHKRLEKLAETQKRERYVVDISLKICMIRE